MERLYVAIIKGPKEYLDEGFRIEKFEITQEEIDDFLEEGKEGETEEDAIQYYREEYMSEWEQRWCSVHLLNEAEFDELFEDLATSIATDDSEEKDHDNEEEEQEEDEWNDWK